MPAQPEIVERGAQPCVSIAESVTMQTIGEAMPRLHGEVIGWLAAHGIAPAGPPFCKYGVIDMARGLEIEIGVPVAGAIAGDDRVRAGRLPAGRYATVTRTGHPRELADATAGLLAWADEHDVQWDMRSDGADDRWAARLEFYLSDPAEQPDMSRWETQLAFRIAD